MCFILFFWQKEIGKKADLKILAKSTIDQECRACQTFEDWMRQGTKSFDVMSRNKLACCSLSNSLILCDFQSYPVYPTKLVKQSKVTSTIKCSDAPKLKKKYFNPKKNSKWFIIFCKLNHFCYFCNIKLTYNKPT